MMDKTATYPSNKGADNMRYLPAYREYIVGNTKYRVSSVFSGKGNWKEIYEKYIVNCEKEMQKRSA